MTSSISSPPSLHTFVFTEPPMSSFSDPTLEDMDNFAKTLQNIKSKNLRPDLLASILSHFASKWLPDLSSSSSTPSSTTAWRKKRDLIENLIGILPPEKDSMPCDFLLRLLRIACMVGAGAGYLEDLERRVAGRLDQASLKEVMIPGFGHTCGTLLDVGLMVRMVRRFLEVEEGVRSGAALVKVGRLVDLYLAEVALDAALLVEEVEELAMAVPAHARSADDGLYRAVDTYIKAHPKISKKEKKTLVGLIDPRKLTPEAAMHAIHNDRLPVRSIIQIHFSEQSKLNQPPEWNNTSFNAARSPNPGLEAPARCPSKREVLAQQLEMRRLRDDVTRLQSQCRALQAQIDRSGLEKKKTTLFKWGNLWFRSGDNGERWNDNYDVGIERRTPRTPMGGKGGKTPRWRNSLS